MQVSTFCTMQLQLSPNRKWNTPSPPGAHEYTQSVSRHLGARLQNATSVKTRWRQQWTACVVSLFHCWRDNPGESVSLNLALRSVHVWRNWLWKQRKGSAGEDDRQGGWEGGSHTPVVWWREWQVLNIEGHSGQLNRGDLGWYFF